MNNAYNATQFYPRTAGYQSLKSKGLENSTTFFKPPKLVKGQSMPQSLKPLTRKLLSICTNGLTNKLGNSIHASQYTS